MTSSPNSPPVGSVRSRLAQLPAIALVSVAAVLLAVWLAYGGMLASGFVFDDWQHLERIVEQGARQYAQSILDPAQPHYFYRPAARLFMYAQYAVMGLQAAGFHLSSLLLHVANCVLWGLLLYVVSGRRLLLLVGAVAFAAFPVYADAVFWISDTEILLAIFFALLCLLSWLRFLQRGSRVSYLAALGCLILALLSKEIAVFIVPVLVALHTLLVSSSSATERQRRMHLWAYGPIALIVGAYLLVDLFIVVRDVPLWGSSYSAGVHVVVNVVRYVLRMATPFHTWVPESLAAGARLGLALAVVAWLLLKERVVAGFLVAWILCTLLPYAGFSTGLTDRYMYAAAMGATGLGALAFCRLWDAWQQARVQRVLLAAAFLLIVTLCVQDVRARQMMFAATTNTENNIFYHVRARHDSFPGGSSLYFLNAPDAGRYLASMMRVRFDPSLRVGAVDDGPLPEPRPGAPIYVFYYQNGDLQELSFPGPLPDVAVQRTLPVQFAPTMSLIGYDVPQPLLEPGKPLLVLLYWRSLGPAGRSYAGFVHLVDQNWTMWAQSDSLPQGGRRPTDSWQAGAFVGDYHILAVPPNLPAGGSYRLEIGFYDAGTLQRTAVVDNQGLPIDDRTVIGPIAVR